MLMLRVSFGVRVLPLGVMLILQSKLEAFIKATHAYERESASLLELWNRVKDKMFSLCPREQTLGLREKVGSYLWVYTGWFVYLGSCKWVR